MTSTVEQQAILDQHDWRGIGRALGAHFPPDQIEWRAQGQTGPLKHVRLLPYLTGSMVQDRLDDVLGPGGWSFEITVLAVEGGELRAARGRLAVYGLAKDGIGTASNFEPSKGCASDCLKRAGVMWGIGRYLNLLPDVWVTLDTDGHVPDATMKQLRAGLARRAATAERERTTQAAGEAVEAATDAVHAVANGRASA
jgi:hypothetical protein